MTTNKELEDQLATAREDIRTLSRMAGARMREEVSGQADSVSSAAHALSDEARALFEDAAREGRRMRASTEDSVRNHPLGALGLAFAAGVVLSGLMNRR